MAIAKMIGMTHTHRRTGFGSWNTYVHQPSTVMIP